MRKARTRHFTFYYFIFDINHNAIFTIPCMEMWWKMISVVQQNQYSVEIAYLWHLVLVGCIVNKKNI